MFGINGFMSCFSGGGGSFMMIIVLGVICYLIYYAFSKNNNGRHFSDKFSENENINHQIVDNKAGALHILDVKFAAGEIGEEEYLRKKELLRQ